MSKKTDADHAPLSPGDTSPELPASPPGDGKGDAKGDAKKFKSKSRKPIAAVNSAGEPRKSFANTLAARSERSLADIYRIQDGIPEHVIEWSVSAAPFPRCRLPFVCALMTRETHCPPPLSLHFSIFSLPSARPLVPLPLIPFLSPCLSLQLKCFGHFDAAANCFSKEIIRDPLLDELDPWEIRESLFLGGRHEVTGGNLFAQRVR